MTDLMQIASYFALAVLVVIVAYLPFRAIYEHFFPKAKEERERINAQIAEQHRLCDEYQARFEAEEALKKANAELNAWRSRGLM